MRNSSFLGLVRNVLLGLGNLILPESNFPLQNVKTRLDLVLGLKRHKKGLLLAGRHLPS